MNLQDSLKEEISGRKSAILCEPSPFQREKLTNSTSNCSQSQKTNDSTNILGLTNKESVFGVCLDQLMNYYKAVPLELDFGFLRNIRKVHRRNGEFQKQQNLKRAAEILAESKNKSIKEHIEQYREDYEAKYGKIKSVKPPGLSRSISQSPTKRHKQVKNPPLFMERSKIKSEHSEDEEIDNRASQNQGRKSLLICPTKNQITLDRSNRIFKRMHKERGKKEFQLPQLVQNKFVACHAKSTVTKTKPLRVLGYKGQLLEETSWEKLPLQQYEFKKPQSIEKILRKKIASNCMTNQSRMQDPEKVTRRDGEELRKNRKLMLELLREKNRNGFFGG